jgi:hypothetical protein
MSLQSLEPCCIIGIPVNPNRKQLEEIIESLIALLKFGVNMASGMPNKGQYASDGSVPNGSVPNGSVVTVAVLISLFTDLMPSLEEVYRGKQVNDASASAIVDALWVLACTIDTLIEQSRSRIYHSRQAVEVVRNALFCVQPKEEDSDGEESEVGPLRRDPTSPPNYLVDVQTALTAIQKHGQ